MAGIRIQRADVSRLVTKTTLPPDGFWFPVLPHDDPGGAVGEVGRQGPRRRRRRPLPWWARAHQRPLRVDLPAHLHGPVPGTAGPRLLPAPELDHHLPQDAVPEQRPLLPQHRRGRRDSRTRARPRRGGERQGLRAVGRVPRRADAHHEVQLDHGLRDVRPLPDRDGGDPVALPSAQVALRRDPALRRWDEGREGRDRQAAAEVRHPQPRPGGLDDLHDPLARAKQRQQVAAHREPQRLHRQGRLDAGDRTASTSSSGCRTVTA